MPCNFHPHTPQSLEMADLDPFTQHWRCWVMDMSQQVARTTVAQVLVKGSSHHTKQLNQMPRSWLRQPSGAGTGSVAPMSTQHQQGS